MKTYNSKLQTNNTTIQSLIDLANSLPEEKVLDTLDNPAAASDLLSSKELLDSEGKKIVGTMTNNGTISQTMDGIDTKSVSIPKGYTDGGTVSLDNTIDNEVSTQNDLIEQIKVALDGKAGGGITLPTLSNPANANDILSGKEAINADGNKITGTIVNRTSSDLSASGATVTAPAGHYNESASYTIPNAEFSRIRITVSNSGLIEAQSDILTKGYASGSPAGGTASLNTKSATTITPTTTEQIVVSAGTYVTGDIKVAAVEESSGGNTDMEDALITGLLIEYTNDRVENIGRGVFACTNITSVNFPVCTSIGNRAFYLCKSLTSINFPVCTSIDATAFYSCTSLTSVNFPECTTIGSYAFSNCTSLTTVSFPVCNYIGSYAFQDCSKLTSISFPICATVDNNAFSNCSKLTSVNFPVCTTIGTYAFYKCKSLTSVNLPICTTIGNSAFFSCYNLTTLILGASIVCALSNSTAFSSTPIGGYSTSAGKYGTIYVPASLLTSYQAATNWTYFSSRFSSIENMPPSPKS